MESIKINVLAAALLAVISLSYGIPPQTRSWRQPVPEKGFWVTETDPASRITTVRFYAASNYLVSERKENKELDIKKLSVRRYLNNALKEALEKDSLAQSLPKLYEIN
ncbi:hypothetical protein [Dyadobacter sp. Leaf189]|uniref:hypothetical protein n=1 Tax=Dyadobacter sp. Leaf189 TaxID=1736295 RepID=UPI0006FD9FC6|nr:hypothetical protein [Dyadobacter sp. Leaf189]KQS33205.1 hypothetical protein ASG33_03720 [Dyadobacter sp. Leaf189]